MNLSFVSGSMMHCCGITEVGVFRYNPFVDEYELASSEASLEQEIKESSPLFVAAFNNKEPSQKAYEYLTSKYTLLYQSPVVTNRVHGSKIFICIFHK